MALVTIKGRAGITAVIVARGLCRGGGGALTPPCNTRMGEKPSTLSCSIRALSSRLGKWRFWGPAGTVAPGSVHTQEMKGKTTQNGLLRKMEKVFYAESAHVGGSAQGSADGEVLVPKSALSISSGHQTYRKPSGIAEIGVLLFRLHVFSKLEYFFLI